MCGTVVWARACAIADVPDGEMLGVVVNGAKLAIYNLGDGEIRATRNVCTHEYALLTDGWLEDGEVECPIHAGRFDVRTGKGLCAPIERDLAVYDVDVKDGSVFVAVPDAEQ